MRLLAAFVWVCGSHRLNSVTSDLECKLDGNSVPPRSKFKSYSADDPESGLMPSLNVKQGMEHYEILEHTNYFKTSEYSFRKVDENNNTAPCGRFHTYLLGRSADLRIGRDGQRKRLVRITSARHGNAFNNIPNQVFYVRDKKKRTLYTIVRKRITALGARGALLAPGKLITHAQRAMKSGTPDLYKIFTGKCKYGGDKPSKEAGCGKQIMTGVGTFGEWGMNWYMGPVTDNTQLEDAVASLQFQEESWGKASLHKKQIFRLSVKSGDVGLIVVNAFLADVIRAMERINMKVGHNFWRMDMR